jgi:hypothetical protein
VSSARGRERTRGGAPGGAYGWKFRPRRPSTLAHALDALPLLDERTLLTAELLAEATGPYPEESNAAVAALGRWLDGLTAHRGWRVAKHQADQLMARRPAPPVHQVMADALAAEGSIGRARAIEAMKDRRFAEELAEYGRRSAEREREMEQILEQWSREREEAAAQFAEHAERSARIERGEASEEDLAWQQRIIEEALASDPEQLERELAEFEAESQAFKAEHRAFDEKMRREAAESRQRRAHLERLRRLSSGRATEEDLAWDRERLLAHEPCDLGTYGNSDDGGRAKSPGHTPSGPDGPRP